MVHLIKLLGAAALLSSSALSAPMAVRRQEVAINGMSRPEEQRPEEPMSEEQMQEEPMSEESMQVEMPEPSMPAEECMGNDCEPPMPEEPTSAMPEKDCMGDECNMTSEPPMETTSTMPEEGCMGKDCEMASETSMPAESTSSMSEPPMPSYGSGGSNWGGYEDCVAQCMAQYGAPPASEYSPPTPNETTLPDGGKVHYVYVAPTDGVPRYTPWAINATVGDTVRFVWSGTVEHSVTMGSELNLCNKSESANSFDSGLLSGKDGQKTFDVKVETDKTQYFYCSKGDHCSKGMWGLINPKTEVGGENTIGSLMGQWTQQNPDLAAAWNVISESTKGTPADTWGNNIVLDGIPESQFLNVASNTLYTRAALAANPGVQEGGVGMVSPDGSPLKFPADISSVIAESNNATTPANADAAPPATPSSSGASRGVTPAIVGSLFALVATIFVL